MGHHIRSLLASHYWLKASKVYLVRHRQDWEALKLKLAKINGIEYEIIGINPDAGHDYMAYDQLILRKEGANG